MNLSRIIAHALKTRALTKHKVLSSSHLWILNHRIQITQETSEESYFIWILGQVSGIPNMDKTTEPLGDSRSHDQYGLNISIYSKTFKSLLV